jgi:hypothetical protein
MDITTRWRTSKYLRSTVAVLFVLAGVGIWFVRPVKVGNPFLDSFALLTVVRALGCFFALFLALAILRLGRPKK